MYGGGAPGGRFMMPGFWQAPPTVIPSFRDGQDKVPPEQFTIDCSRFPSTPEPVEELVERMKQTFDSAGVVRLTNTGLTDVNHMKTYADVVVKDQMTYEGGANPRQDLIANVYDVGAPHNAWLHYHHEMAYNQHSMKNLAFCSIKAPAGKGDTYLSENISVTDELLKTDFGQKLKDRGVCYIRCLTDKQAYEGEGWMEGRPVYNHWQTSFGTDCPVEAETKARSCGLDIEWVSDPLKPESDRYMKTKLVISAFEYCPAVDRNVLFSSIADHNMWFDTWQGVAEVEPSKRPLQMTFGDGSPISVDELKLWVHLYDRGGIRVQWQTGDVVAFCNYRYAHGRPAFELNSWEERQIGVMLGEKFDRVGVVEGAW